MIFTDSATHRARRLLDSGDPAQAVQLVSQSAKRGDGEALHELALWHVYGFPVRRDFALARLLFGRAADAGYRRAAIPHAVFVAMGAGAMPDWREAFRLLERAARDDAGAARQVKLLAAMNLAENGDPRALPDVETLSDSPDVARYDALFSSAECAHVVALSEPLMAPSIIIDSRTGRQRPDPIRTSSEAVLGPIQQDLVIHALNLRIAAATATKVEQGEPLVVLRYEPHQQYREHHDCLPGEANQRIATAITYLNDDYAGGETSFVSTGLDVKGRTGAMIRFANTHADGRVDMQSRHAGRPVQRGNKWICTRWIRSSVFDPWGIYTPSPLIS